MKHELMAEKEFLKYNRIKVILAEKDKSVVWLAEQIQKDRSTINRYVRNERQPTLDILFKIADALEVDVRKLISKNKLAKDE